VVPWWALVALVVGLVVVAGKRVAFAAKPGAVLSQEPAIEYARRVVSRVWANRGHSVTVTSGYDGSHKANSLHYVGLAEDYRTRDVPAADLPGMVTEVRAILGRDYDVVLEPTHLHVEYDPK
jgi:hypothetical protein